MKINIREYRREDLPEMIEIWNQVVREGVAFPQKECLNETTRVEFFREQSYCGVAEACTTGEILGLYILHPNNVGRCGHICNASYAVRAARRGQGVGRRLVTHCLEQGRRLGFGILQFNAVVRTNTSARRLYEELGFIPLGVIPGGFQLEDGTYEDIIPYYHLL